MDGMNWYAYCGNNPVMFIDPSGLSWDEFDVYLPQKARILISKYTDNYLKSKIDDVIIDNSGLEINAREYWHNQALSVRMQYLDIEYIGYANNDFKTFGVTETNYRRMFGLPENSNHTYYQMLFTYAIELQHSSSTKYMVRDENGFLTDEWIKAVGFIGKIEGISRNNKVQNAQVDEAVNRYKLSKEGRRKLHDEISGKGYGFEEILEYAEDIANQGGKYVNK